MIDITQEQIMQNWGVDNSDTPIVSVRCITYNQESFIAQALDGFLMQRTSFPFEIIVHDDASTDKTVDIIREYERKFPKILKPIYETENQYSKHDGSLGKIVNKACKGKYHAFCEGDDYWIDPHKLQKQVTFLEKHPDYGMCYTRAKIYNESSKSFIKKRYGAKTNLKEMFIHGNSIPTASVCIRNDIRNQYVDEIKPQNKGWKMGDLPMWLYCLIVSKIKFIPITSTVYRIREESASHYKSLEKVIAFKKSARDIRQFIKDKYNLPYPINDDDTLRFNNMFQTYCKCASKDNKKQLDEAFRNIQVKRMVTRIKYCCACLTPLRVIYKLVKSMRDF